MTTIGEIVRPWFPGRTLPDTANVGLQRAVPVGPPGGMVRDGLGRVFPGETFADGDWVTVTYADSATLASPVASAGPIDDSFSTTTLSSAWTVLAGAPTVSGGLLHLRNTYPQNQIRSTGAAPFAGTTLSALGVAMPAGAGNDAAKTRGVMIQAPNPVNFLQFMKYGGTPGVLLTRTNPGTTATFPYNAVNHANYRIRSTAGTIFFEVSANGTTWTTLRSTPAPAWVATDSVRVMVYGGASSAAYSDSATETTISRIVWA